LGATDEEANPGISLRCGESSIANNSVEIERGKDDHTFRLDPAAKQVSRGRGEMFCAKAFVLSKSERTQTIANRLDKLFKVCGWRTLRD
jgi:hypothetical protein